MPINPTEDQIEQCAQICYEAQRALLVSRGLSAVNQQVPPPWAIALDSDKHAAREKVVQVWPRLAHRLIRETGEVFENQEELLAYYIIAACVGFPKCDDQRKAVAA